MNKLSIINTALCVYALMNCLNVSAQKDNTQKRIKENNVALPDSISGQSSKKNEEGNRNVMLNASSANGPREIQIGLPSSDVNVLENGLPVVYNSSPRGVNSTWRADASLSGVGLQKISETAITTGNIGYAVTSETQLGEKGFHGALWYKTNHFGMQEFSFNLNGGLGKDWFYSASAYQNFDPGTFKIKLADNQDRTQIYKLALTKRYGNGRGELSAIYNYSKSYPLYNFATQSAPFIYVGDGSVQQLGDFKLGTQSYLPVDSEIVYRDMRTGELSTISLYDASENVSNNITLVNKYNYDNGVTWNTSLKYGKSLGAVVYQSPMSLQKYNGAIPYTYQADNGTMQPYTGEYVQSRMSCINRGNIDELMLTTEISKKWDNSTLRIGVNEWYYNIDYTSNTSMYDQSVPVDGGYAVRLYNQNAASSTDRVYANANGDYNGCFYDLNKNASEYYNGYENKLALYITNDWDITSKLNLYLGARLEHQRLRGENAAVRDEAGNYVGRFADYYLGATAEDGTKINPTDFSYDWFNYCATAAVTYKVTQPFGLTGDFTYITQRPRISNFAPATMPNTDQISVPLGRAGIYYNNKWLSLTSLFSYISKTNNNSTLNLQHQTANGSNEIMAAPLIYDIQTWGWTTDIVANPFKGFNLHFLFTYQNPTYKKYETSVEFSDGYVGEINATGNIVAEIPQIIVEIDPSYNITEKLRLWASFRYFGKTYANINEAYFFKGRWETFAGIDWKVNSRLDLGCNVVNFLNQTGARGSIAGAELVTKEEASQYAGAVLAGSYLRPFTVEFNAKIKF